MAYDTGYTSFFKLANEASWGNADAPDDDCLLLEATGNIEEDQGVEQNFGTGSRLNNQNTYGNHAASGSITGKIQGGRMIAYGLGADSGSVATGLYTHTMTPLDTTDIPSMNIGKYHINTDKGREMSGTRVNDFSLNLDVGGQLTGTFNLIGKQVDQKTSTVGTRTQSTSSILTSYMGTVTWNSSAIDCTSFAFNYNNNLGGDERDIGDRRRAAITQGEIAIDGTFVLVFSDFTVYDDFQDTWSAGTETGTAKSLVFSADNGGASTAERELTITMANVNLNTISEPIELGNGRIVQEYSYVPKTLTNIVFKDTVSTDYIDGNAIS